MSPLQLFSGGTWKTLGRLQNGLAISQRIPPGKQKSGACTSQFLDIRVYPY
jgi:hypothetical protein